MPMLRIRGIHEEIVKSISKSLVDDLQEIVQCPRDYFTIELINNHYIMDGQTVPAQQIIEVAWFDRGQEIQDKVALAITRHFQQDISNLEIYFVALEEKKYYENGSHL